MKKWKRILSAVLAVLLLSGSMPVWAAETVDPDEQAGDIQELKEKLEGLIPEEELGKYTKKEPIGEARVEGETQDRSSFFRQWDHRQRSGRGHPMLTAPGIQRNLVYRRKRVPIWDTVQNQTVPLHQAYFRSQN